MSFLKSERGELLVHVYGSFYIPVIAVELCQKWYSLWLIRGPAPGERTGVVTIEPISYDVLEPYAAKLNTSAYRDHVPNPACVRMLAEEKRYEIDPLSEELLEGRWRILERDLEI